MSYESREKEYWRLKVEVKIRAGNGKKRWRWLVNQNQQCIKKSYGGTLLWKLKINL